MPSAPRTLCLAPGGCALDAVTDGRCAEHHQVKRHLETRFQRGNYGRPHRRRIAAFQVKYPDRVWCEECLKEGQKTVVEEYDHIIPHRGDPVLRDDIDNLQPMCKRHHSAKTAAETLR